MSGVILRKKLVEANILKSACALCGITEWLGQPAPLELDHINGIHTDNRLKNLRILCRNCHGLQDTHAGRNVDRGTCVSKGKLCACGNHMGQNSKMCKSCYDASGKRSENAFKAQKTKIDWPSDEELLSELSQSNFPALGKKLGVSANAIRNRLKRRNLI